MTMIIERTAEQKVFETPEMLATVNGFTELEKKFMDAFVNELYAEPHFSDVGVEEIAKATGESKATVKGVLGSLVKKRVCQTDDNGCGFDIIYLTPGYFWLHPTWRNEELY
jgi:predicted transcriptional regulator